MRFPSGVGLIGSRGTIWFIYNGYLRSRVEHMKILCPTNVETFYTNLTKTYNLHKYE